MPQRAQIAHLRDPLGPARQRPAREAAVTERIAIAERRAALALGGNIIVRRKSRPAPRHVLLYICNRLARFPIQFPGTRRNLLFRFVNHLQK